ncbi:MAG: hypothetical protein AAB360_00030 [Patescibacteria group bacterium]
MKKVLILSVGLILNLLAISSVRAEGGIFASGGGAKTVGQTFTVTVAASGTNFDSLQGIISVSGPVDVVSFAAGGATWLPGKTPSNGGQFVGITSESSSITVATIKLKGKSVGNGNVSVSGAKLANKGSIVGTGAGGATFSIAPAPDYPDKVAITSPTHPDPNVAYEATTVTLNWEKESGVTGFAYVLDQTEDTAPASKVTSAETTVTYADQAIGVYYFHIKAQNRDGWGPVNHFKITIKEPEAKIDPALAPPANLAVKKTAEFTNDIESGTVTGITISGQTEPGFSVNLTLDPALTVPEGKTLTALAGANGYFELNLDYPVRAGFYKLTVQGQKDKILTPVSNELRFEINQAAGGTVNVLTDNDRFPPVIEPPKPKQWYEKITKSMIFYAGAGALVLMILSNTGTALFFKRRYR